MITKKPPKSILDLVDVQRAPYVLMDDDRTFIIFLYRDGYKTIEELSQKELRLAGLRINPKTNIGSRVTYYNRLGVRNLKSEADLSVKGLPTNLKMSNFKWSPHQKKLAFTNTTTEGVEVWVLDVLKATAFKITDATANANLGDVINWFADEKAVLVKMLPPSKKTLIDAKSAVPTGPTISVNDGKKAQNRTYQDLLKNKNDEFNFEQLATSEIYKVYMDGKKERWLGAAMYNDINFSPDGEFVMVNTIEKPFSYLVPYYRFPLSITIYKQNAEKVETVVNVPLIEDLPKGFMSVRKGRRRFTWRNDKPATLVFAMALDEGDPAIEVEYRDEVFQLEAPFNGTPTSLLKTMNRYSRITWANDHTAIASDYWWNNRNTKSYVFDPSNSKVKPTVIFDRNYQDRYADPGSFETKRNDFGRNVLAMENESAFLLGDGHTKEGQFPFLDKINLKTGKTTNVYRSDYSDKLESLRGYDANKKELLVRIESKNKFPNFYFRDLNKNKLKLLTNFESPFKGIDNLHKEVITYKRPDGVELSGTLYLPLNYEKGKKYPMVMWAYPTEYKDKSSAGQKTQNPNRFTYPYYGSPIYWATMGYVILDNASFPIVGEGDTEPNDSFREQLVSNAKSAIDAVDKLGYIDRNKVAVGGHSYGAFMVANLLSHSNLFAAGIARSGAYNRTLTPFGFQSEERHYWDAPEVYYTMSPFMHADKMKTPLLLVHGGDDNNSGTYTMQSERYFNALKGLGATVRLVILPKESHGYRAKESVLHLLWEQDQWLDKHVKNRSTSAETAN